MLIGILIFLILPFIYSRMMWMQCRRTTTIMTAMCSQHTVVPCLRKGVLTCSYVQTKNHRKLVVSGFDCSDNITRTNTLVHKSRSYVKDAAHNLDRKKNLEVVNNDKEVKLVSFVGETLSSHFEDSNWENEMNLLKEFETRDVLAPLKDTHEIDLVSQEVRPTFNLAAYINRYVRRKKYFVLISKYCSTYLSAIITLFCVLSLMVFHFI